MDHPQPQPVSNSILDSELLAGLLPSLVELYQLTASGVDATRQLEIARLASSIRDALNKSKEQARDMPGADLTLQDQQELIAVLERELRKRRPET